MALFPEAGTNEHIITRRHKKVIRLDVFIFGNSDMEELHRI
jgi:hypothetical protein